MITRFSGFPRWCNLIHGGSSKMSEAVLKALSTFTAIAAGVLLRFKLPKAGAHAAAIKDLILNRQVDPNGKMGEWFDVEPLQWAIYHL